MAQFDGKARFPMSSEHWLIWVRSRLTEKYAEKRNIESDVPHSVWCLWILKCNSCGVTASRESGYFPGSDSNCIVNFHDSFNCVTHFCLIGKWVDSMELSKFAFAVTQASFAHVVHARARDNGVVLLTDLCRCCVDYIVIVVVFRCKTKHLSVHRPLWVYTSVLWAHVFTSLVQSLTGVLLWCILAQIQCIADGNVSSVIRPNIDQRLCGEQIEPVYIGRQRHLIHSLKTPTFQGVFVHICRQQ